MRRLGLSSVWLGFEQPSYCDVIGVGDSVARDGLAPPLSYLLILLMLAQET